MLKSLYPEIDWNGIEIIGLDMDGTLYDERDFIFQVYHPIASRLSLAGSRSSEEIHSWMFERWQEKGSSYNHIFEEVLSANNVRQDIKSQLISDCLRIFHDFSPNLCLSAAVKTVLDVMHRDFNLFLVSDGSNELQMRKFRSLNLGRWVTSSNVGISGKYGASYYKPAIRIIEKIEILKDVDYAGRVVYFGDRDVDAIFSNNAGFEFVRVNCMKPIIS